MREFVLILPEVMLVLTLLFVVFAEISYHGERTRWVTGITLMGLGAAFVQTLITYQYGPALLFGNTLSIDGFSLFFKLLLITLAGLSVLLAVQTREIPKKHSAEYFALILASTLAMSLAAGAVDLLLIAMSLQLMITSHALRL